MKNKKKTEFFAQGKKEKVKRMEKKQEDSIFTETRGIDSNLQSAPKPVDSVEKEATTKFLLHCFFSFLANRESLELADSDVRMEVCENI